MPNTSVDSNTYFFTALPCEAKPLIDCYKLKKDTSIQTFNIFRNENIVLTITGIGKTAMSAGVAYTLALFPPVQHPVILNVGIAGHQDHAVGSLFLVDKITDRDTGKNFYPPLIFTPPCPSKQLITFAKAQDSYPETALCDMEASAFYETATRFSTGELIHCLKSVSDNRLSPAKNITPQQVSTMLAGSLAVINDIVRKLYELAGSLPKAELIDAEPFLQKFHFTASERVLLKKLLTRWHVLMGSESIHALPLDSAKNASEFIKLMEQSINEIKFYL